MSKMKQKMDIEERRMQLKLERLRLERKTDRSGKEERESNQVESARIVFGGARSSDLPHFIDEKDDLDSYLLGFKKYATFANWPQTNWAT